MSIALVFIKRRWADFGVIVREIYSVCLSIECKFGRIVAKGELNRFNGKKKQENIQFGKAIPHRARPPVRWARLLLLFQHFKCA